jgi:hypothetical protein
VSDGHQSQPIKRTRDTFSHEFLIALLTKSLFLNVLLNSGAICLSQQTDIFRPFQIVVSLKNDFDSIDCCIELLSKGVRGVSAEEGE